MATAATTATTNAMTILDIFRFGHQAGIAFGLYEEIRDLVGAHGRRRATELEHGKTPLSIFFAQEQGFPLYGHVGQRLSDNEYSELMRQLKASGALARTANLVHTYFHQAMSSLGNVLQEDYVEVMDALRQDVEHELRQYIN